MAKICVAIYSLSSTTYFTATIGFEMAEYRTSESAGDVSVCVTVRDTDTLNYDLTVYIDLLPSTATGEVTDLSTQYIFNCLPTTLHGTMCLCEV